MTRGFNKATGKHCSVGRRATVEQRRALREANYRRQGLQPNWSEEALDFYLAGQEVPEILRTFDLTPKRFYNGIAKAALYRLMVEHQAQRLDEIPELTDDKNK